MVVLNEGSGKTPTDFTFEAFSHGKNTFQPASEFLSTRQRIAAVLPPDREDTPPAPISAYGCRIGLTRFVVPPVNINVTQRSKAGSVAGAGIRQKSSPKFSSGHTETVVTMTVYFPNVESIWGVQDGQNLVIDFQKPSTSDEIIDTHLSSLRGLIAQFRYAPFLPIENEYLNGVFGITGVAMRGMTISTVPNFPFTLAVTLTMMKFNHRAFLPMIENFSQAIHYGRYRSFMGRAAARMNQAAKPFKLYTPGQDELAQLPEDSQVKNPLATPESVLLGQDRESLYGAQTFERPRIGSASDPAIFDLYYPFHTPANLQVDDLDDLRPQKPLTNARSKSWWEKILGGLGVDVNVYDEAHFEQVKGINEDLGETYYENRSETQLLLDYFNASNIILDLMGPDKMEEYVEERLEERDIQGERRRKEVGDEIRQAWFRAMYKVLTESPAIAAELANDDKFRRDLLIDEWEVPLVRLDLDPSAFAVEGFALSMGNVFSRLQLQMQDEPTHQHIGGEDIRVDVSLVFHGEKGLRELGKLRRMFETVNGLARIEQAHGVLGFLGIKNVITQLAGVRYVLPQEFNVETVPGMPRVHKVTLSFLDFDIFQQKREQLSMTQQAEIAAELGKRNPMLRIRQLWGCVDVDTEIMTKQGWKKWYELDEGDDVLTLNHDTGVSEWNPCQTVNTYDVDTEMLHLDSKVHSSMTSPDHRWPVLHKVRENLEGGRSKVVGLEKRWATSEKLNSNDYLVMSAPYGGHPESPVYSDDLVRLMAWIWTEGSAEFREGRTSPRINIYQSHTANPAHCARIFSILHRLFGPPVKGFDRGSDNPSWRVKVRSNEKMIIFKLNTAASRCVMSTGAFDTKEKVISREFLLNLTKPQLDYFVESSFQGDGHMKSGKYYGALSQSVTARTEALEFAAILAGWSTSLIEIDFVDKDGVERSRCEVSLRSEKKYNVPPRREQKWVSYKGVIWCPTTKNGTWLARREGKSFFTGNSMSAFPDFPLDVRDENGRVVGHLDPDYYFRAFKQIDDDFAEPTIYSKVKNKRVVENAREESIKAAVEDRPPSDEAVKVTFGQIEGKPQYVEVYPGGRMVVKDGDNDLGEVPIYESAAGSLAPNRTFAEGTTPLNGYNEPLMGGGDDPTFQFEMMARDMQYRDISGRMVRAFPTYMLWIIDEGGNFGGMKLFDNFYGLQSVLDISLSRSKNIMADTLVIRLSNLFSKLSTPFRGYLNESETDRVASVINQDITSYLRLGSGIGDQGTEYLVDLQTMELKPGQRLHLRMGHCVDESTEILTKRGWLSYEELKEGDIAYTLNHETGLAEWSPVEAVNVYSVENEDMVFVDGRFHSSLTTLNHKWPVYKRPNNSIARRFRDWTTSEGIQANHQFILAARYKDIPKKKKWSDELVEVLAWFWAEGHITNRNHPTKNPSVVISQSRTANPEYVVKIRESLTKLIGNSSESLGIGGRWRKSEAKWRENKRSGRGETEFRLNVTASEVLLNIAPDKLVPKWFIEDLTKRQLEIFIETSLMGDRNSETRSGFRIKQKNHNGLDSMELASMLLGYRTHRYIDGTLMHDRNGDPYYMDTLSVGFKQTFSFTDHKPKRVKYSGVTWCPTTKNKTWMARREGKAYFTGNSSDPNALEVVFNGVITEVQNGEILTVVAQSDAVELGRIVNNSNEAGHSGKVSGSFSGLYMSEPRDLMIDLLNQGSSVVKEVIAAATQGEVFSENRYGIAHFGKMLYTPLTEEERDKQGRLKNRLSTRLAEWDDGSGNPILSKNPFTIAGQMRQLLHDAAIGLSATRDYEIFKRNIYPGNGIGVSQYAGGNIGDIILNESRVVDGVGVNPNGESLTVDPLTGNAVQNNAKAALDAAVREELRTDSDQEEGSASVRQGPVRQPPNAAYDSMGWFDRNRGRGRSLDNNLVNILGLKEGAEKEDDVVEEVAFRAQTYMKTVWDLFKVCATLLPDYIVAVRPFEERSTVFYGKPYWLYTSGVIPVSTGTTPKNGPALEGPNTDVNAAMEAIYEEYARRDEILNSEMQGVLESVAAATAGNKNNPSLGTSDPTLTTGGMSWSGAPASIMTMPTPPDAPQLPFTQGPIVEEMHLPTSDNLQEDIENQKASNAGLPPGKQHPFYMDRVEGGRGGYDPGGAGDYDPSKGQNQTVKAGDDFRDPGTHGAYGLLPPDIERYYFNQYYEKRADVKAALKFRHVLVYCPATQKAVVTAFAEHGPALDTGYSAGCSPEAHLALGNPGKNTDCLYRIVDDSVPLGPVKFGESGSLAPSNVEPFYETSAAPAVLPTDKLNAEKKEGVYADNDLKNTGRSQGEADDIWEEFRANFASAESTKQAFRDSELYGVLDPEDQERLLDGPRYEQYASLFQDYLWSNDDGRAWVVKVINRHESFNNVMRAGKSIEEFDDTWSMGEPLAGAFKAYIDGGTEGLQTYMVNNADEGEDASNSLGGLFEGIGRTADNAWDGITGLARGLSSITTGLINMVTTQIMQLTQGMTAMDNAQQKSNLLSRMYNDSIYYSAGLDEFGEVTNKLLFWCDNPFSREYGEPVVEIREPFQRMHLINSSSHIINNDIYETMDNVANVVTAVSNSADPITVHFDKGIPAERQFERVVESGLFYDNPEGLEHLWKWRESARDTKLAIRGQSPELMVKRVALAHLKQSLEDIYQGEITLIGDATIRPYDMVYMADVYSRMSGFFEVGEVVQHLSPETGFITSVTPNAVVTVNDPARFYFMANWAGRNAVAALRNDFRERLRVRADGNSELMSATGVGELGELDIEDLAREFEDTLLDATQFYGGNSAIIKNMTNSFGSAVGAAAVGTLGVGGLLAWPMWKWVRDNLLDQHGLTVNFLTKNGLPMDAGMSYAEGVAVGQKRSLGLVMNGLKVGEISTTDNDGNTKIRTQDVVKLLQWDEIGPNDQAREVDLFVDQTLASLSLVAGKSGETLSGDDSVRVYWIEINYVVDADTFDFDILGEVRNGQFNAARIVLPGRNGNRLRLTGAQAFEDRFNQVRDIDKRRELSLLYPNDPGIRATEFARERLLGTQGAIRVSTVRPSDANGRTLGFLFHNVPGTAQGSRRDYLTALAYNKPLVPWSSFDQDGQPVTFDWELIQRGYADVIASPLNDTFADGGVSGDPLGDR